MLEQLIKRELPAQWAYSLFYTCENIFEDDQIKSPSTFHQTFYTGIDSMSEPVLSQNINTML